MCVLLMIGHSNSGSTSELHPLLYFSQSDVEGLRAKATTTHAKIFYKIQELTDKAKNNNNAVLPPESHEEFTARWNEEYGNRLAPLAFYCLLRPQDKEAGKLTIQFMDRMAGYPNWQVKSSPLDEVPVSHSLVGFATAYDILYSILDDRRRTLYLNKIKDVTENILYARSMKAWWGKTYIQNHVATNVVALLTGALVVFPHDSSRATKWRDFAVSHLNRTLQLLDLVVDGSMDEGTGYGSYTTRSLTQFVFLVKRHLHANTAGEFWFRQHFQFMLGTTLPGYAEIVGIGDSAQAWFYGPESQLVFLDSFVLKNGNGNWLASRIRETRLTKTKQLHSEYCTLFTEYVWYDASITEKSPFENGTCLPLMRFSDAGLVSYNGASQQGKTFLSFKSGAIHGRAVYVAVENRTFPWLQGWKNSLNPGHEHPDQNSFVFYPRGKPFIMEALYGPKFTFLNNVLTFGPSKTTKCYQPHEGQLGECGQWLDWKTPGIEHAWAEVIGTSNQGGMVFASGEAVHAYSRKLGLKHVYRALILLSDDILLLVDHIELHRTSQLKFSNAYFHNLYAPFVTQFSGTSAVVLQDGEEFVVHWAWPAGSKKPTASVSQYDQPRGKGFIRTHFLNISVPLTGEFTRVVYAFSGPQTQIQKLSIDESTLDGVRVRIHANGKSYFASVVTNYLDPRARLNFIDSLGYAQVRVSSGKVVLFAGGHENEEEDYFFDVDEMVSFSQQPQQYPTWLVSALLAIGMLVILTYIVLKFSSQKKTWFGQKTWIQILFVCAVVSILAFSGFYYYNVITKSPQATKERHFDSHMGGTTSELLPSVFVSSLRGSGGYLVKAMFNNHTDFFYADFPSPAMANLRSDYIKNEFADACQWLTDYHVMPKVAQWFTTCFSSPQKLLTSKQDHEMEERTTLLKRRQLYPNSIVVLLSEYQNWNLKLPWLVHATGRSLKVIYLVRDPRSWIADQLKHLQSVSQWNVEERLRMMFVALNSRCKLTSGYPSEYDRLRVHFKTKQNSGEPHKLLALLWQANTAASLRIHETVPSRNYLRVKYEDLVDNPVRTAQIIYSYLGLLLPMSVEHRLLQMTKSNVFGHPNTSWRQQLSTTQVRDIEDICGAAMALLNYNKDIK